MNDIAEKAKNLTFKGFKVNLYSAGKAEIFPCALKLHGTGKNPLIVMPTARMASEVSGVLREMGLESSLLGDLDVLPFESLEPSREDLSLRISALKDIIDGKTVVTDVMSVLKRTDPPEFLMEKHTVSKGEALPGDLAEWLVSVGYSRVLTVRSTGEFAVRGNVFDLFSPKSGPVRMETFDVEVESIRTFDPETQLSVSRLESVELFPILEFQKNADSIELAKKRLVEMNHPELFTEPEKLQGMAGLFWKDPFCAIDYLPDDSYMIVYEPSECEKRYGEYEEEIMDLYDNSYRSIYNRFSYAPFERLIHSRTVFVTKKQLHIPLDDAIEFSTDLEIPVFSSKNEGQRRFSEEFEEIKPGTLVVHTDHGIGLYDGTDMIEDSDGIHEYLKIFYKNNAILYVPVEQFTKVTKYIGSKSAATLSDINGREWRRTKEKIREDVEAEVGSLIKLYAMRDETRGFAFSPESELEESFERSFKYIETPDQLRALEEVFEDMESEKPMDRLICGDAGFGKTEVAMRAAFRAVVNGKQVLVLAPTMILAQQHHSTFVSRMESFGVEIAILTSQTTASEKRRILREASEGKTDVIIGTHALISGNLSLKDLGLVIIDEEQRFGTKQKDFLKRMRLNVDVLTLSATPIPRTLHMGLVGIKEMSVIQTPPVGRSTPKIYTAKWNEKILRGAILREIGRGGQIFYVHNRIEDIKEVAKKIGELFPFLKIADVHGRMPKQAFVEAVKGFYSGDIDILVATSVIENGVDVPNANTLIIDDVQRYGLGQLYQLKGRVGRSNRRAFVYFMYSKEPSPLVRERLNAISKYADPGSAMELALKDMEIRGVGEVLGLRQHGHIDSVGLHMYREILRQTIQRLRGLSTVEEGCEPVVSIPSSVLPERYVPDPMERMKLYRRLAAAAAPEVVDSIEEEMIDRFGRLPKSIEPLLDHSRIRALLCQTGISSISSTDGNVEVVFKKRESLPEFVKFHRHSSINPSKNAMILLGMIVDNDLKFLLKTLLDYKKYIDQKGRSGLKI